MTFALTCNLHSVGRKGPDAQLAYFLRTIHAHVPTAHVILVLLLAMFILPNDIPTCALTCIPCSLTHTQIGTHVDLLRSQVTSFVTLGSMHVRTNSVITTTCLMIDHKLYRQLEFQFTPCVL